MKKTKLSLSLLILLFSTSCVETVIVGSVATGALVVREKTFNETKDDVKISSKLGVRFIESGLKTPGNSVDTTVNEGRVLLTGIIRNPDKAKKAYEIAWGVDGVKEVIDEVQVDKDGTLNLKDFSTSFKDYIITTEVQTRLLFAKKIASINYVITTVNKTVYLLGVAQDKSEMRRVISIVSRVRGVDSVINHVVLENDRRRRS